mgnify:FL=1
MNKEEILGAFSLVNNPIVLSEEEVKDVQKAIKKLQQENQKYKEVIDKAIEYINDNLTISSILDGEKYYTINNYSFDYKELLDILKEVE